MVEYEDEDRVTAHQAFKNLLRNVRSLNDAQWGFVNSCAGFTKWSEKQEEALIRTWLTVERQIEFKRAKAIRRRLRKQKAEE